MTYLPYLVTLLTPFQSVLAALGGRYLLYAVMALGAGVCAVRTLGQGGGRGTFGSIYLLVLYLAALALARTSLVSVFGFLTYALFPIMWVTYHHAYGPIDLARLARVNLVAATVVAIIGIYQYFLNPTLWGFSTYSAIELHYVAGTVLRINSLLPSAMSLGAYLVLSALFAIAVIRPRSPHVRLALAILLACAFLTGNKSTLFSLGTAVVYFLIERTRRRYGLGRTLLTLGLLAGGYGLGWATASAWGPWLLDRNATVHRAIAPFFFTGDVGEVRFLLGYWRVLFLFYGDLNPTSLLLGNGIGLTRQATTFFGGQTLGEERVAESFLVQLVYEVGLVGLVLFHVVVWAIWRRLRHDRPDEFGLRHVLAALYANLVVVHVFSLIYLGFLWAVFVATLATPAGVTPGRTEAGSAPAATPAP